MWRRLWARGKGSFEFQKVEQDRLLVINFFWHQHFMFLIALHLFIDCESWSGPSPMPSTVLVCKATQTKMLKKWKNWMCNCMKWRVRESYLLMPCKVRDRVQCMFILSLSPSLTSTPHAPSWFFCCHLPLPNPSAISPSGPPTTLLLHLADSRAIGFLRRERGLLGCWDAGEAGHCLWDRDAFPREMNTRSPT